MKWNLALFWYLYALSTALFVGKIAIFSFLFAPIVHSQLEKEQAAKLLRTFFPRYYKLGIICAILASLSIIGVMSQTPILRMRYTSIIWAIILIGEVFALKVLYPIIETTREGRNQGNPELTQKWEKAHRCSVRLNVLNLLLSLIVLGCYSL